MLILIQDGQLNIISHSQVNNYIMHKLLTNFDPFTFASFLFGSYDEETGSTSFFEAIKVPLIFQTSRQFFCYTKFILLF